MYFCIFVFLYLTNRESYMNIEVQPPEQSYPILEVVKIPGPYPTIKARRVFLSGLPLYNPFLYQFCPPI
jgi:hypothetical protein